MSVMGLKDYVQSVMCVGRNGKRQRMYGLRKILMVVRGQIGLLDIVSVRKNVMRDYSNKSKMAHAIRNSRHFENMNLSVHGKYPIKVR